MHRIGRNLYYTLSGHTEPVLLWLLKSDALIITKKNNFYSICLQNIRSGLLFRRRVHRIQSDAEF